MDQLQGQSSTPGVLHGTRFMDDLRKNQINKSAARAKSKAPRRGGPAVTNADTNSSPALALEGGAAEPLKAVEDNGPNAPPNNGQQNPSRPQRPAQVSRSLFPSSGKGMDNGKALPIRQTNKRDAVTSVSNKLGQKNLKV